MKIVVPKGRRRAIAPQNYAADEQQRTEAQKERGGAGEKKRLGLRGHSHHKAAPQLAQVFTVVANIVMVLRLPLAEQSYSARARLNLGSKGNTTAITSNATGTTWRRRRGRDEAICAV